MFPICRLERDATEEDRGATCSREITILRALTKTELRREKNPTAKKGRAGKKIWSRRGKRRTGQGHRRGLGDS